MKRLLNVAAILTLLVMVVSFSGCFQYPEGPFFTLQTRDERIEGTWRLTLATDPAGADVTSEFSNITLTVIASRSGDNSWTIFKNGNLLSQGTYQFASHGHEIVVAYSWFEGASSLAQFFYSIRKLTDKNFYYIDDKGFTLQYEKY